MRGARMLTPSQGSLPQVARAVGVCMMLLLASGCARLERLANPSPRETYQASLTRAGLGTSALAQDWIRVGEQALAAPLEIASPFRESGYLSPTEASAVAYRLSLERGRRLTVSVTFDASQPGVLFVELFRLEPDSPVRVAHLELGTTSLDYAVSADGTYVLRVQPELLRGGRYTLIQRTLATLRFPVSGAERASQGVFGAERDAGRREHEGVDIFSERGTPVHAVADGLAQPGENRLGGTVVWHRDANLGLTYYYAHLDRTALTGSTAVRAGDVIGYVGNTGNARRTPPHLHFGIYDRGAIDPAPFLRHDDEMPPSSSGSLPADGQLVRVSSRTAALHRGPGREFEIRGRLRREEIARVVGATTGWRRVQRPDDSVGYIPAADLAEATAPLRRESLKAETALLERPAAAAPTITTLETGSRVDVLGTFDAFLLVRDPEGRFGWAAERR
jgi:peptidoglycan LD-endopeptidase LytH